MHLSKFALNSRYLCRSIVFNRLERCIQSTSTNTFRYTSSSNIIKVNHYQNSSQIRIYKRPTLFESHNKSSSLNCSQRFLSTKGSEDGVDEPNSQLPATVAVPEVWPHVPVIAINKNIVFPRFIKLIEVSFIYSKFTIR